MTDQLRIARILVPVDGSECSRYAARHAVRFAQAFAGEIVFLHVVDDQLVSQLAQGVGEGEKSHVRDRLFEQGSVYVHDVARLAAEQALAHREAVAEGDPCAVVCDTATRLGVDLIVIGKTGRRGARRILVGSLARRVIECSTLPVLIVSAPPVDEAADIGR